MSFARLVVLVLFVLGSVACDHHHHHDDGHGHGHGHPHDDEDDHDHESDDAGDESDAEKKEVVYACPNHPELSAKEPARCPKCNMFLTPVKEKDEEEAAAQG
ncbi:MAG: heavy metal-binding domain-containing protein [Acidobacteriota bacterium]